jgi:hypothetical protein
MGCYTMQGVPPIVERGTEAGTSTCQLKTCRLKKNEGQKHFTPLHKRSATLTVSL